MLLIRTTIIILTKLTYNSDIKIRTGFLQLIIHQWHFQYIFLNLKTLLDCGRCAPSQPLAGQLICEFIIMGRYATVKICNNTSVIMTHSICHMLLPWWHFRHKLPSGICTFWRVTSPHIFSGFFIKDDYHLKIFHGCHTGITEGRDI